MDSGQTIAVPQGIDITLEIVEVQILASRKHTRTCDVPLTVGRTFNSDALAQVTEFRLEPQKEGGFVAFSNEYSGAVGQGETEEEAIDDLQKAISLLIEVLDEEKRQG